MSHEITHHDNVLLRKERAWHGLGDIIQDDLSCIEAAKRCGLLWNVRQDALVSLDSHAQLAFSDLEAAVESGDVEKAKEAYTRLIAGRHEIDSHVANVREDTNALMGVVGAGYEVCENRVLAEFMDSLANESNGDVVVETCGSLRGGKRVWFLAKADAYDIGTADDKVWSYLCGSNGHDGGASLRLTPTDIRAVCANTLRMVIPREGAELGQSAWCIRHTSSLKDRIEDAKQALAEFSSVKAKHRAAMHKLADTPFDPDLAVKGFANFYAANFETAVDEELTSVDAKVRRTAELRMERMSKATSTFLDRYHREKQQLGANDNAWLAFNAISGWVQHDLTPRGKDDEARIERRVESNLFGLGCRRTHEALDLIMSLAG